MEILSRCVDCQKLLSRNDAKRCAFCYQIWKKNNSKNFKFPSRLGNKNPRFNRDNTHNNKCVDCNKHISKNATRCCSCSNKEKAKNNIKQQNYCILCKKEISKYADRCHRCASLGKLNGNWKNGISSLSKLIRGLIEYSEWSKKIFNRDNYTCQNCNKRGGNLEIHHIKSFNNIFQEFIQTYNQFSIYEDKETLLRLAITYKDFWNVDNGITLCKECHKITFMSIK